MCGHRTWWSLNASATRPLESLRRATRLSGLGSDTTMAGMDHDLRMPGSGGVSEHGPRGGRRIKGTIVPLFVEIFPTERGPRRVAAELTQGVTDDAQSKDERAFAYSPVQHAPTHARPTRTKRVSLWMAYGRMTLCY